MPVAASPSKNVDGPASRERWGSVTFNGLTLDTAPGEVMTPRATSERLLAAALARIDGAARVADVGTGTGALAIAIAARRPGARVWATDADERAVALARANVVQLDLGDRVFVCHGDLLEPVPAPLDLIVANLPYLPARSTAHYPDLISEPFAAVFAAGDGLDRYRRLIRQAAAKLAPRGTLLLQLRGGVLAAHWAEPSALRDRRAASIGRCAPPEREGDMPDGRKWGAPPMAARRGCGDTCT